MMGDLSGRFLIENVGAGVLAPALATALLAWAATRFPARPTLQRALGALALPVGFLAGYLLLPWAPIRPTQPWHWLPWVAVVSAAAGVLGALAGPRWGLRLVAIALAAAVSAWCLVPDWTEWLDRQPVAIGALAVLLTALATTIRPLAVRPSTGGRRLVVLLAVATIAGALVLGLSQNLKFAQLAGLIAASLGGWVLVAWRGNPVPLADAIPAWAVLVGGLMFLGWAYSFSSVPLASYLLVPCAPLGLWVVEAGWPWELRGARRIIGQVLCVVLPLLVALGLAIAADLAMA